MPLGKSWTVNSATGGQYPAFEPIFFPSNKNKVAIPTALAVKIYLLSNKQVVTKVPLDCTNVVQILLTKDEEYFFIVYDNGTVEKIDLSGEGTAEKVPLNKRIIKILTIDDKNSIVALYHTESGISLGSVNSQGSRAFFSTKFTGLFAFSNNNDYVAFVHQSKKETQIETFHLTSKVTKKLIRSRPTSSIAISNHGLVAVGAPSGVIDIYYTEGVRSLKWHLEEVKALHFSLHDNYLVSGGSEKVLVFWQMDADKQQFLPRLDGAITGISSNANTTFYTITLSNSQVLIINAVDLLSRLQVSGVRTHFSKLPSTAEKEKKKRRKTPDEPVGDYSTIYKIHPSTRNAYFVCPQGDDHSGSQVQIYNPIKDEQEAVLNLVPTIPSGKVRSEQQILDPSITHFEFTSDGKWMATVDITTAPPMDSLQSRHEIQTTLKFWRFENDNKWSLVTKVIDPHGSSLVAAITSHPRDSAFITASRNGGLRLWKFDLHAEQWTMRRSVPPGAISTKSVAVAWSNDASTIAFSHETSVSLIDANKWTVHSQLPNILGSRVRGIWFCGKYLVALAKDRLIVWDVVMAQQSWSVRINSALNGGRLLAIDPVSGHLAVAVNFLTPQYRINSRIILFDVTSPTLIAAVHHNHAVSALNLVPGTSGFSFVDVRGVISSVGSTASATSTPTSAEKVIVTLYNHSQIGEEEMIDEEATTQRLGVNSFDHVFTDEGASLETLFERVMRVVG